MTKPKKLLLASFSNGHFPQINLSKNQDVDIRLSFSELMYFFSDRFSFNFPERLGKPAPKIILHAVNDDSNVRFAVINCCMFNTFFL